MERCFVRLLTMCLLSYSSGLDLRFHLKGTPLPGERLPCGVLTCVEKYTTSDSSMNQDHVKTNSSTISSMKVFTTDDSGRRQLVASVTSQQPNMTRVSNGIKVEGHLGASAADLRLELLKSKDCSAAFTCEVRSLDVHGTEVVSSNQLQQQLTQRASQIGSGRTAPEVSTQLMMIAQQLILFENRLEDRIRSVEDKIEGKVADKLCQLEAKLTTPTDAARFGPGDKDVSENFLNEQMENLKSALAISGRINRNLNESFEIVDRHLNQLEDIGKINLTGLKRSSVGTHEMPGAIKNCTEDQNRSDMSLRHNLLKDIKQLELGTCNSSAEALLSVRDEITETNTLINNNIQPVSDLLMPKQCRRGLVSLAVQTRFPYPVIRPNKESGLNVSYLCDETTDGGGWIIIQRRTTGEEDFYRDWATYRKGFGSLAGDFWLGNENLHTLTNNRSYELRVELKYDGRSAFAHYDKFSVASEADNYAIEVGNYDGTAGDCLIQHNGSPFTTFDRDNDEHPKNCAKLYIGAWWYTKYCHNSNLNGKWGATSNKGPRWEIFSSSNPTTYTEMKIRSLDF
ncbi:hypothetical protein RRG08_048482 [Elysia crispata]|uniref:Fibrinogen C-terminal domain-containing protein n=1 Tax=Elysia crispata TaxID=231223 RepID=A0AAE0YX80_9GAST|nr:hypothetical protein RRG08_048482 [Elysia crispata]